MTSAPGGRCAEGLGDSSRTADGFPALQGCCARPAPQPGPLGGQVAAGPPGPVGPPTQLSSRRPDRAAPSMLNPASPHLCCAVPGGLPSPTRGRQVGAPGAFSSPLLPRPGFRALPQGPLGPGGHSLVSHEVECLAVRGGWGWGGGPCTPLPPPLPSAEAGPGVASPQVGVGVGSRNCPPPSEVRKQQDLFFIQKIIRTS